MARNRKKAKERRARRPQGAPVGALSGPDAAPDPIAHASPDVELAEAQLALGRPELSESEAAGSHAASEPAGMQAAGSEPAESEPAGLQAAGSESAAAAADEEELKLEASQGSAPDEEEAHPAHSTAVAGRRPNPGSRLVTFAQGSWRELQRVQWPDRRQVMQATGVVIGFVIVAGAFLGVADFLAGKVMNYILTGNFK